MKPDVDVRFEQIQNFLIQLATGNFDYKVTPSESLDELDALIVGINMLGEELKFSQEKHITFFEHGGDAILIYSVDSNTFVDSNEMATVLLGFTKEDLRLLTIEDLFSKEEKKMIESKVTYLKSVLQTSFDTQIETKNGELKYVSFLSKKLPYGDGKYFQISLSDITEARQVSNRLVSRNLELKQAQKEIGELSKFPSENPNPILRFNEKFKLVYNNAASTINFLSDFQIKKNSLIDRSLINLLKKVKSNGNAETFIETRNERHYSLTLVYVQEFKYINIYGSDITDFINQVNENEKNLLSLKDEIEIQKEFYEFILNNIPADVAVFDKKHKYVYINPHGIQNDITREFMIGKDDFDYVNYKGISDQKAVERRKIFKEIIRSKDSVNWEDEFLDKKENRKIVHRTMAPLFDDKGKIRYVIGYGTDITKRVLAEETIQDLNTNLEKLVEEKTAKNIELSNSLRDQEKLVTIGELAAGVAHDLNTPLGAIKSGVENVKYTLRNLLNENILLCTSEEINFALNYVKNNNFDLFVGGMQMSREVKLFKAFLKETYPGIKDLETLEVSTLFVKNRIPISELITVQHIINSENTIQFLNLIYNLQIIFSFVDTISISGEKASLVVQDLRSFIKEKKNTEESIVNLHDNIKTVLNIFNHNIKNLIELNFNVNKNLTVKGYDVRLFQLWSNLIKNAIESMEDLAGLKELNISSKHTNQTVTIIIENNGPMIQSQHIDKIFEKFYTTKGNRNGSGLGLSIVKNVLEEHEAKIRVRSNEIKTQFEIIFNKVR